MIIKIEKANWITSLADAIETTKDGDTIIVHTIAMKELAIRIKDRMCPDKKIQIEVNRE